MLHIIERSIMKKFIKFIVIFFAILIVMLAIVFIKMGTDMKNLSYQEVNMNSINDGLYRGKAETSLVKVEVEVEIKDKQIIRIDILKHDNGKGEKAEQITSHMIDKNTYDVDALSGATTSSEVIKSAVSNALSKAN